MKNGAAAVAVSTSTTLLASLAAVAIGMGLVLQVGVNASLAREVGHELPAAVVSFVGGTCGLALVHSAAYSYLRCHNGIKPEFKCAGLRWFELMGGVLGCSSMVLNLFAFPVLGFALSNIMQIAGRKRGPHSRFQSALSSMH